MHAGRLAVHASREWCRWPHNLSAYLSDSLVVASALGGRPYSVAVVPLFRAMNIVAIIFVAVVCALLRSFFCIAMLRSIVVALLRLLLLLLYCTAPLLLLLRRRASFFALHRSFCFSFFALPRSFCSVPLHCTAPASSPSLHSPAPSASPPCSCCSNDLEQFVFCFLVFCF